jgi:hypothetical protein
MNILAVTHCTKGTDYENDIPDWIEACEQANLDYEVVMTSDTGSWVKNTRQKASAILGCFNAFTHDYILYVDVDGRIISHPLGLDKFAHCDISTFYITEREELLSGTILIKRTERALKLLKIWEEACANPGTNQNDQRILAACIEKLVPNELTYGILPPEYCHIKVPKLMYPSMELKSEPVIEHLQHSRIYKEGINKNGKVINRLSTVGN